MAVTVLTSLVGALAGVRISDYATSVELGVDVDVVDTTTFGSGAFSASSAGIRTGVVNINGLNDIDGIESTLAPLFGGSHVVTVAPVGDTAGSIAGLHYGVVGAWRAFSLSVGQASSIQIPIANVSGGRPLEGLVTQSTSSAVTSTATTTAVNCGAAASGAWASLHVLAVSGTLPTITAQLQSSTTAGGSYAARGSASASRSTIGGDWITGATTTDTWWRLSLTVGGTNPSFTVLAAIGVL